MDLGPVVIEFDIFLSTAASADEQLQAIADSFQKQYACFKDDSAKKTYHYHTPSRKNHQHAEKPRIGTRELSREAIAKKDFIAMINKLSPQNVATMKDHCKGMLRIEYLPMYIDMLWDAMLRSPDYQSLYIEILGVLDKVQSIFAEIHRVWDHFVATKGWMLNPQNDSDASYDDFCDHVKAKKRAIASVKAWIRLAHEKLCDPNVIDHLIHYLLEDAPTDISLEQLMELYKEYPSHFQSAMATIKEWHDNAASLTPMVRFKMMDLWELLSKK